MENEESTAQEDEEELVIEINIQPRSDQLAARGLTVEDFNGALPEILDEYHEMLESLEDPEKAPSLFEIAIIIKGKTMLLRDVADIQPSGDIEALRNLRDLPEYRMLGDSDEGAESDP